MFSVSHKFERIVFDEHIHPDCPNTPLFLVRYVVDGRKTPYFWALKSDLVKNGPAKFFRDLEIQAEASLHESEEVN